MIYDISESFTLVLDGFFMLQSANPSTEKEKNKLKTSKK